MPEIRNTFSKAERIGLGSGRTIAEFLWAADEAKLLNKNATYYASSTQIASEAERLELALGDPTAIRRLQVTVDGADQVLPNGWFVKGGGGALFREKLFWEQSDNIIVLATYDKVSETLTVPVPVEVHPWGVKYLLRYISYLGGTGQLRRVERGGPFVTENGNFIVDANLSHVTPEKFSEVGRNLKLLSGVIEVGFFYSESAFVYHPSR